MNDMSETKKERLSAFMDDEIGGRHEDLVDDLLKDPELLDTWSRYHLISDGLKQGLPEAMDTNLARNVSDSLRHEPAIVAPGRSTRTYLKPVAGFAIAASVAALAILGIQQQQPGGPHEVPGALVQSPSGGGNVYAPVREVSSTSTQVISECSGQAAANGGPKPDTGQQAGSRVEEDQTGENCR